MKITKEILTVMNYEAVFANGKLICYRDGNGRYLKNKIAVKRINKALKGVKQ